MPCLGFEGQLLHATIVPIFMRPAARCRKLQFENSLSQPGGHWLTGGGTSYILGIAIFSLIRWPGEYSVGRAGASENADELDQAL